MKTVTAFWKDQSGGPAAEFALVLPIAMLFLFGIIDVGRFMWEYNRAEKATQMGARFAVVTDAIPTGLKDYSFVGVNGLTQGDLIPTADYGTMTCAKPTVDPVSCSCVGICGWGTAATPAPFQNIVDRMRVFFPRLATNNVTVEYVPSGLGFAGDPNGSDVAPLVTIRLTGMTFKPIILFNAVSFAMPDFSYSLTMEDGAGVTTPN